MNYHDREYAQNVNRNAKAREETACEYSELRDDAPRVVGDFLEEAINKIDEIFGAGYAAKNPEMLSAALIATSNVAAGMFVAKAIEKVRDAIELEVTQALEKIGYQMDRIG